MGSQGSDDGKGQGPYDSWGRPRGGGPQRPGPDVESRSSWDGGPSSPIPGMTSKDFKKMCRSVDKAFSQFARLVEKGSNGVAEALGQSPEKNMEAHRKLQEKRLKKEQRAQTSPATSASGVPGSQGAPAFFVPQAPQWGSPAKSKGRFRSSAGLTASGVVMAAIGGAGTLFSGTMTAVGLAMSLFLGPDGLFAGIFFGLLTAAFATLLGFGIRNLRKASKLKALQRAVGAREAVDIGEIAAHMQVSPKSVLATARMLIKGGYLPQGRIDDEGRTLMVTENAYHQYLQFKQTQRQALADEQAAQAARAAEEAQRAAREQNLSERLTPEQCAFIARGRDFGRQMEALAAAIDDAAVSEKIAAIQDVLARILARAEEEPGVIDGLGRLNDYYLPTTVKLLAAYDDLEEQPVQGENISGSRREIEHTLDVLCAAFEKLLDETFQDLSLDVSSDISVLHAMLAQEGLVPGPFDGKSQPARAPSATDHSRKDVP